MNAGFCHCRGGNRIGSESSESNDRRQNVFAPLVFSFRSDRRESIAGFLDFRAQSLFALEFPKLLDSAYMPAVGKRSAQEYVDNLANLILTEQIGPQA